MVSVYFFTILHFFGLLSCCADDLVSKPVASLLSPKSKGVSSFAEKVIEQVAAPLISSQKSTERSVIKSNPVNTTDRNVGKIFLLLGILDKKNDKFCSTLFILVLSYIWCSLFGET